MQSLRIGIVGTGFIARNLATLLYHMPPPKHTVVSILTRRKIESIKDFPFQKCITNSINELVDSSDLVIECSGSVIQATLVTQAAFEAALPVLTMNSEFHITTGSYFVDKGYLSECEGDQPGCIAALKEDSENMGFQPLILGNFKGFLDNNPSEKNMQYWADKQDFTVKQTTSFTDGTKVQIEQAFVANGLDGTIFKEGLMGSRSDNFKQTALKLAAKADDKNIVAADYIISDTPLPSGIFIAAKHNDAQRKALNTYKLGEGPYYVLHTNYHLCAFEILKTVNRYLLGLPPLLNNKNPEISVAAIAKDKLSKGTIISSGVGSTYCRGEAIFAKEHQTHVPIGILENATLTREIEAGEMLTFDDIELKPSAALDVTKQVFCS